MNLGALVATLGINSAGLTAATASMKKFETQTLASVNRINASLATTGAAMKSTGRSMTMYMSVPMALIGGAAFKMHKDFEFSMSKIVGLVGVAREQVDAWSGDILKMAPQLGKAPKELADALFFITSAGVRGAEAMDVLEMSAKASASGLGETKDVADLVTSAMNAYGKEVLSAQAATDVLTAAVREGKAQADALASTMGMVLPIASNMGVQFHEVGAAVAAMTRTGTSAQTASMQLRQILAALLKPSQQAERALWAMSTSSAELRKTIREDGLLQALMDIKDLTAKYGETVMSDVFPNIRALSGVLDVMGANLEDNKKIFRELEAATGSLGRAFEEASNTAQFKWDVAISSVKTSMTVLGGTIAQSLIPLLEGLSERMKQLTLWFENLREGQRRWIMTIGGIVIVLGPLTTILGVLVGSVIPRLIWMITKVIGLFKLLRVAILANPMTALAGVIALVVAKLTIFKRSTKEAEEAQTDFNEALREGQELMGTVQSIDDQMRVLHTFNKRQLEDMKSRIMTQIAMEEDYTTRLVSQLKKRLDADKDLKKWKEELMTAENKMYKTKLMGQISIRQTTLAAELELEFQGNQKRLQQLKSYLTEVNNIIKTVGGGEDGGPEISPAIADALAEMVAQMKVVDAMSDLMGDSFDDVTARVEILRTALQSLLIAGMLPTSSTIQDIVNQLEMLSAKLEEVARRTELEQKAQRMLNQEFRSAEDVWDGMYWGLKQVEIMEKALGNTYDESSAKLQVYTNALQELTMLGYGAQTEAIQYLIEQIKKLNEEQGEASREAIRVQRAFVQMGQGILRSLGQALMGVEQAWWGVVDAILSGAQQIITALLIESIANIIAKETSREGVYGLIIAAAGIAAMIGMWEGYKSKMQKASKMAYGGTVPPGYPNDTYPAMLTSGETVTPPIPLSKDGYGRAVDINLHVKEIRVSGEDLVFVFEEYNRKRDNSFGT